MRLLRGLRSRVVVIIALAIMNGCGASPSADQQPTSESKAAYEGSTEAITSPDSLSNVVPFEPLGPVSALEISNAPQKTFLRDKESGALIVTFADLNLKAAIGIEAISEEDVKRFPNWLKSLNAQKIRIRGYMFPTFEETGIDTFYLDHSLRIMNFGSDPKIYELMQVKLAAGTTTNYVPGNRSMEVIGIFRIKPDTEDGRMFGLYFLEDAVVVAPKPREGTP